MKEIRNAEARTGMLTKSLRITHALWATNKYLAGAGKREKDECPLCHEAGETNDHLKAHCADPTITAIRSSMTNEIAAAVQERLGDRMPDEAWQMIANLWTVPSLRAAYPDERSVRPEDVKCKTFKKGHRCRWRGKHGHLPLPLQAAECPNAPTDPDADEYECLDEHAREYLRDMAKPGARTAWAGWFPKSFAKLLRSFDIPADAATGLALKIRSIITGGMDEIWSCLLYTSPSPRDS